MTGSDNSSPVVSVGIPTFNRPEGLKRTLGCIAGQTFPNLEIIVSDNHSPDPMVRVVAEGFCQQDRRIKYFRQPANQGAAENFRFVLRQATGDYFMWAADDDEWDSRFIETCMQSHRLDTSVMTAFDTVFRQSGKLEHNPLCSLSPENGVFANARNYLSMMQSSLLYGVHPRKSLSFVLEQEMFDFYDCYLVLRLILERHFRTVGNVLYRAGVDAASYEVKYAKPGHSRRLRYWPFLRYSAMSILGCTRVSIAHKLALVSALICKVAELRRHHGNA